VHDGPDAEGVRDAAIVPDATAGPLWAGFYELCLNRPVFLGRDSEFRYSLDEVEQERRAAAIPTMERGRSPC
jgi:PelA/Pel-15E family pectate lyase